MRILPLGILWALMLLPGLGMAQPANDNPCNATAIPLNATYAAYTTTNATASNVGGTSCGFYNGRDVWFSVTVPASGVLTVQTNNGQSAPAINNGAMAIYQVGACGNPASYTELACNTQQSAFNLMPSITLSCLTPGQVLLVRFWAFNNAQVGSFRIRGAAGVSPPAPPANNTPCSATALNVGSTCSWTSGTNVNACNYYPAPNPGCGNNIMTSRDVWYSFVAPPSGVATIQVATGSMSDPSMAVYRATSCSGNLSLLRCSDDEGPGLTPLIGLAELNPGETYYIRIWGFNSSTGTFSVCVTTPPVPAGDCVYAIQMYDSAENGWGSSSVGVSTNGGSTWTNHTVTAGYNVALVGFTTGQVVMFRYLATGPNQSQNRFVVRMVPGGGGVHSAGPSPPGGTFLITTIDCVQPLPPSEDCSGGQTICNAQAFTSNSSGTGFSLDLTPSNFGCLSNAERQGTWYFFSPSIGGQVAFSIDPVNPSDDYDFALWGPMNQVVCPPPGPPTRCSYAAPSGSTGLSYSADDFSEAASGDKWTRHLDVNEGEVYIMYVSNWSQSGLAFDLNWDLQGGASLDCTVLPITLVAFEAVAASTHVDLYWATATETNNDHFIVERSPDGKAFTPIGRVEGQGNSYQLTSYHLADEEPLLGLNHYRLAQVDHDGTRTWSNTVTAFFQGDARPHLWPNPTSGEMEATFEMRSDGPVLLRIDDASGRLVRTIRFQAMRGINQTRINTQQMQAGSYTFRVSTPEGLTLGRARFVKQ